MPDQRTRHLRGEQHRHLAGRQLPRIEPFQRALRRLAADRIGLFQVGRCQRHAVPAVALHGIALAGDQRAADAVRSAALAAEEAVRIGIHADRGIGIDRRAVGIADPRIAVATGLFAGQGQVDGALRIDVPRMPAVELALGGGHQLGIGQPGGGIVLGESGDRAGLGDRRREAVLAQVGGAGAALALAEIDRHRDAAVAGGFDRLHLAHAHVDRKPAVLVAADFGLAGAGGARLLEQALGHAGQPLQARVAVVGDGGDIDGWAVQWIIL